MLNDPTLAFWAGDPLRGIVMCGSVGLVTWSLVAALVGCILGMLRDLKPVSDRASVPRPRRPRARLGPLPPRAATAAS
jgi:hypothetical protein